MSADTHLVLMGTCGWKHPGWLNDFYSEDLPEDWQLGFYSNEFPVVYVPVADWLEQADLSEWTEDVSESFRFVLEISAALLSDETQFETAIEKIKALDEFCLGLVFQFTPNICNDTTLIQKRIEMAQTIAPVCIDKQDMALSGEMDSLLASLAVAEVWDGQTASNESNQRGKLAICRVSANELEMPALKKVVEGCLSASTDNCVSVLCFDGAPPSLDVVRNANVILNLL